MLELPKYTIFRLVLIVLIMYCICLLITTENKKNIIYKNKNQLNVTLPWHKQINKSSSKGMKCYTDRNFDKQSGLSKIDDILLSERRPKKGKSIFFHETTCSKTGILKLNARQACAIESAALLNPNFDIFVLFASPVARDTENGDGVDANILKALDRYKNIYFRNVNLWSYADDTPIEKWLDNGGIFDSHHLVSHVSDLLRFTTLWRWGGTHLDLDVVLIKTLENIKPNFVGSESQYYLACGIINVDYDGIGHEIASMILKGVEAGYKPNVRSSIGPLVVTSVFKKFCKTNVIKLMTPERCSGFQIFGTNMFYAVRSSKWNYFFSEKYLKETIRLTNESIAIHLWSSVSSKRSFAVGSKVAYGVYAEKYCPNVYGSCGINF